MKKNFIYLKTIVVLIVILLFHSCGNGNNETELLSPDGKIKLIFYLSGEGKAGYLINYSDNKIIDTSYFSFDFQDQESFGKNLEIVNIFTSSFDQTWQTVWGEQRFIRNNYKELKIDLQEKDQNKRRCFITFRVFNDGVGFRFDFPEQENFNDVVLLDENTQFKLTGDYTCWWSPGDWDIYEHLFNTTKFSEIRSLNAIVIDKSPVELIDHTEDYWRIWMTKGLPNFADLPSGIVDLYKRSLLTIRTMTDNHGGIIAANDSDLLQFGRDTYSYVWPRDAARAA